MLLDTEGYSINSIQEWPFYVHVARLKQPTYRLMAKLAPKMLRQLRGVNSIRACRRRMQTCVSMRTTGRSSPLAGIYKHHGVCVQPRRVRQHSGLQAGCPHSPSARKEKGSKGKGVGSLKSALGEAEIFAAGPRARSVDSRPRTLGRALFHASSPKGVPPAPNAAAPRVPPPSRRTGRAVASLPARVPAPHPGLPHRCGGGRQRLDQRQADACLPDRAPGRLVPSIGRDDGISKPMVGGQTCKPIPLFRRWAFAEVSTRLSLDLTPIVAVRGPRQVGKTTIQEQLIEQLLKLDHVPPSRFSAWSLTTHRRSDPTLNRSLHWSVGSKTMS